jgi:kinesin family member C2/C3
VKSEAENAWVQVRDLLIEKGAENRNLEVQNTRNSGTNVPDAQQIEVSNTQDVLDVMERGQSNRATADTKMNEVLLVC